MRAGTPEDAAAAEALFNEAIALQQRGQWRAACTRFEASYKLDPATGTLHNLADCHAKEGRLASAWAAYRQVADEAEHAVNARRLKLAREAAQALEPRLPRMVILVTEEARVPGLQVDRDGSVLVPELLGAPLPVDPGEHTIRAEAPGYAGWSAQVQLAERETLEVPLPLLQKLEIAPAVATPVAAFGVGAAVAPNSSVIQESRTAGGVTVVVNQALPREAPAPQPIGRQIVSGVFAGVAVAGVIAGAVYWKARGERLDDAKAYCDGSECEDENGLTLIHDAQDLELRAIISWSVAGAGAVLSLAIWPWGSLRRRGSLQVSAGPGRLQLSGRF